MIPTLPRVILNAPATFVYDLRVRKWELIEEGPAVEGGSSLEFLGFLQPGETYIKGRSVLTRVPEMGGAEAGQHHLEQLLVQAKDIPQELRPFYLVATATKWWRPDGFLFVPALRYRRDRWELYLYCVDRVDWCSNDLIVRVRR